MILKNRSTFDTNFGLKNVGKKRLKNRFKNLRRNHSKKIGENLLRFLKEKTEEKISDIFAKNFKNF